MFAKTIELNGKVLSDTIMSDVTSRVEAVVAKLGIVPKLATILVGEDPASATYVKMKGNACKRVGMESVAIKLSPLIENQELFDIIQELNNRNDIFGILLQHPIPSSLDERRAFDLISIDKDVDGVTAHGFGNMAMQSEAFGSATPLGIMKLLKHYEIPIEGRHAVVIGRSAILGKPMSLMLLNANATVTTCHSRTVNLPELVSQADIVVAAVGRPEFVKSDWIKPGTVVVDAGYHKVDVGNEVLQVGDVETRGLEGKASALTPVPGGVGPMTIATLILQTLESAERKANISGTISPSH